MCTCSMSVTDRATTRGPSGPKNVKMIPSCLRMILKIDQVDIEGQAKSRSSIKEMVIIVIS